MNSYPHSSFYPFFYLFLLGFLGEVSLLANTQITLQDQQQVVIQKATSFLLQNQNNNGSWGDASQSKGLNIYAKAPGGHLAFQVSSTALSLSGLLAHYDAQSAPPTVKQAIQKANAYLLTHLPDLRRPDLLTTYNIWGHAYGLRALCSLYRYYDGQPSRQIQLKKLAQQELNKIVRFANIEGGWGYLDGHTRTKKPTNTVTSFMTATVLLAAYDAKQTFNLDLPPKVTQQALSAIKAQQNPDLSYFYSRSFWHSPTHKINRTSASLARSQACNAALFIHQDSTVNTSDIDHWLTLFEKKHGWLDIARKKPIPHESFLHISGYFYYYGIFYARECIDLLPSQNFQDQRTKHFNFLQRTLFKLQETDGSWWDYPLYNYHQFYGTGYALLALRPLSEG